MHSYAWVRAWAETFVTAERLHLVVVGSPERPVALAPLIRRTHGVPRLELVGREVHEPMDLVYKQPADVMMLAARLLEFRLPLLLARVPADSPTVQAVHAAWRGRGVVICRPALGLPWIALDRRWAELEPPLRARRRSDLRRAQRSAEKLGPVRCDIVSPSRPELATLLGEAFRVEAASWKGRAGTALAMDATQGAFYRRFTAAACDAGILRLCFLRIGGRSAAMQIALETEGRFWLLKIGYDHAFADCSPGTLLVRETVRYAAARGLQSYEFLGTPEPWIRGWTDQVRPCVSIRAYPAGPWGVAALTADLVRAGWRKLTRACEIEP